MSGADYRQQQEEEELFQWAECQGINAHEFVDGQAFAKHKRPIPIGSIITNSNSVINLISFLQSTKN